MPTRIDAVTTAAGASRRAAIASATDVPAARATTLTPGELLNGTPLRVRRSGKPASPASLNDSGADMTAVT